MKKKTTLLTAFFVASFIASACDIWFSGLKGTTQIAAFWVPIIIITGIVFAWVHTDSAERQYQRFALLNIGIVGLALVFVPVYLFKSRPSGAKAKALGYFCALFLGYIAISYAGATFAQYVQL
ncbi:MAG: hypothetical protein IV108_11365 [Burkholderiales bacterium]|nr:hypothetical protein [Burkholderiales bacterium]